MDHLVSALLLAVSSNVDNFGVGVAYGLRGRGFPLAHNLLIAAVSGSGTLLSMAAGAWLNHFTTEEYANWIGSGLLILIGLHAVIQALRPASGGPPRIAVETTTPREASVLAISLTFNNIGTGLGAGISHVSIPATTALTALGSIAALAGGPRLGKRASTVLSTRSLGVSAGLIITVVGIYEIFV